MAMINVPEDLLAELRSKAAAEGKSVDEVASEALRQGLDKRAWQDLLEYGRQTGRASGYTDEDVPRLVEEWRREHRR
jgi:plasmid stability protein